MEPGPHGPGDELRKAERTRVFEPQWSRGHTAPATAREFCPAGAGPLNANASTLEEAPSDATPRASLASRNARACREFERASAHARGFEDLSHRVHHHTAAPSSGSRRQLVRAVHMLVEHADGHKPRNILRARGEATAHERWARLSSGRPQELARSERSIALVCGSAARSEHSPDAKPLKRVRFRANLGLELCAIGKGLIQDR